MAELAKDLLIMSNNLVIAAGYGCVVVLVAGFALIGAEVIRDTILSRNRKERR